MNFEKPYRPSLTHKFYDWLERLPFPTWLFYFLILVVLGASQHAVAWIKGVLQAGEFNLYLAFSGIWLIEVLVLGGYMQSGAARILDEFRPMLDVTEEEYELSKYEFTRIPLITGTAFFLLGATLALLASDSARQISPEINFSAPALTIGAWMITAGLGAMFLFQIVRQLSQISKFYNMAEKIDLFNLSPLYAFSKMTAFIGGGIFVIVFFTPLAINPESLQSDFIVFQTYLFALVSFAIFYIPLAGGNQRLITEKEKVLKQVNHRIGRILFRIHAIIENQDYKEAGELKDILASLREEKAMIESVPTWPWRPETFRGFVSAIILPVIIWLIQQFLGQII